MSAAHSRAAAGLPADGPGVTRLELACELGRDVSAEAVTLVRRWGHDRAVPAPAIDRMCELTSAALDQAAGLPPWHVTVCIRWADPDRARVDVRWYGRGHIAKDRDQVGDAAVRTATLVVDTVPADDTGERFTPTAWMVIDGSAHEVGPVGPPSRC